MVRLDEVNEHTAVRLENERLSVCVLPEKGADIYQITHRPSGVQFLMQTPSGLKPPKSKPTEFASGGGDPPDYIAADFLENYEGGWQELFPNPGDAVNYNGAALPFHGEAALLPWEYRVTAAESEQAEVAFHLMLPGVPLRLERIMRLLPGEAALEIVGRVTNISDQVQHFCWGHHVVLGGDFLESRCRMEAPAGTIHTPAELYEPATAKLAAGQTDPWPHALGRDGSGRIDLREVPGPDFRQHDDIYLTGLTRGEVQVTNPRLGLAFRMEWAPQVFGCITNWRPLGGADEQPLTGIYGLGIEPWTSRHSLTEAIEKGEALSLKAGEALETRIMVRIVEG